MSDPKGYPKENVVGSTSYNEYSYQQPGTTTTTTYVNGPVSSQVGYTSGSQVVREGGYTSGGYTTGGVVREGGYTTGGYTTGGTVVREGYTSGGYTSGVSGGYSSGYATGGAVAGYASNVVTGGSRAHHKVVAEDIPVESRIEYIPFEKKYVEYDRVERVERVPFEREIVEYEEVAVSERVPV